MFEYILSGLAIYYTGFYAYCIYLINPNLLLENKLDQKNPDPNNYTEL